MGGFAIGEIAAELAVFDDVGALRGDAFVVVGEAAEAGAMIEARYKPSLFLPTTS